MTRNSACTCDVGEQGTCPAACVQESVQHMRDDISMSDCMLL